MERSAKLSPKQRVLRKYPMAYCDGDAVSYVINAPSWLRFPNHLPRVLSSKFRTESEAWADAARRLKGGGK